MNKWLSCKLTRREIINIFKSKNFDFSTPHYECQNQWYNNNFDFWNRYTKHLQKPKCLLDIEGALSDPYHYCDCHGNTYRYDWFLQNKD